jgi:hypothetical protein
MGKHNHSLASPTTVGVPVTCARDRSDTIINAVVVDRPSPKPKKRPAPAGLFLFLSYIPFLSVSNAHTHGRSVAGMSVVASNGGRGR